MCHIFAAWALWYLGYPDQGLTRSQEALTLAQQRAHPFSLSFALSMAAMFHQFRREMRAAQERAEATISLATVQGFPIWRAIGAMVRTWALAQQGQAEEGIAQMHQGLTSPSCHRGRDTSTVVSRAPRRGPWHHGTARGRSHGACGSADTCGHNRRTVVRARAVSAQRRTPVTTACRQSRLKRKPVSITPWR